MFPVRVSRRDSGERLTLKNRYMTMSGSPHSSLSRR